MREKFQDLDQLITEYVDLQCPPDEVMENLSDEEARERGETARGKAERVITLLMDTGLTETIRKRAGRQV